MAATTSTAARIFLVALGLVVYSSGQARNNKSDNNLLPPSGIPNNLVTYCDFKQAKPCGKFYHYSNNKIAFEVKDGDGNSTGRSMPTSRYISTGRQAKGIIQYGTDELYTSTISVSSPIKALCLSFRYSLTGNASLALVEDSKKIANHEFWKDSGKNQVSRNNWRYHVSQVSSDIPVRVFFRATVYGGLSSVSIADLILYNSSCFIQNGSSDTLVPYQGASRAGLGTDAPYWPRNATIPYEIQDGFTADQKAMLMRFMNDVSSRTCLRFVLHQRESDYLNFLKADSGYGCSSDLGNVGISRVTLDDDCFTAGYWNIAHMILHAVGLRHEHVRPDRNDYVDIFPQNVDPSKIGQFAKRESGNDQVLKVGYDYNSVMHFFKDQYAAADGLNTIQRKNMADFPLGNTNGLSEMDYQKIAAIYCSGTVKSPPPATTTTTTTTTTPRPALLQPCTLNSTKDAPSGVIQSTQVSGKYRPNENCGWFVSAPTNRVIQFKVTLLEMEESEGCAKDSLIVFDGDGSNLSPIMLQLCGADRPVETYVTTSNKIFIFFSTDGDTQDGRGFSIQYSFLDPAANPDSGSSANAALSPADCNFESSACGYSAGNSGDLKWSRRKFTGLANDHSTDSSAGVYLSIDATTATDSNQFGLVRTTRIQTSDQFACFAFWYRFVDSAESIGKLQVYAFDASGGQLLLWSSDSDSTARSAYKDWQHAAISLARVSNSENEFFRIVLNGSISDSSKSGGIAVDDIIMTQDDCNDSDLPPPIPTDSPSDNTDDMTTAPTPSVLPPTNNVTCDFESGWCSWVNGTLSADANWRAKRGKSTSGSSYGVSMDRTKNTPSGTYLLLNSLSNQKRTARIETSVAAGSGFRCFELYYFMYGLHLGRLRVLVRLANSDSEMLLFEASGNKPAKWIQGQVSVDTISQGYTLIVEGVTTGLVDGDIAVDDFLLRKSDCYSPPVPDPPPYRSPPNPYFCDFEDKAFCASARSLNMFNGGDTLSWVNTAGGSDSTSAGGPMNDHSQKSWIGRFAVVKGGNSRDTAYMTTKKFEVDEVTCLNFWYYLGSSDTGSIKVVAVQDGSSTERQLYTISAANRFVDQWVNPQITIPAMSDSFVVKFIAISGGAGSFIAIDDIEVNRNSKCQTLSRSLPMFGGQGAGSRRRRQAPSTAPTIFQCRFGSGFCDFTGTGWKVVTTSAMSDTDGPDDRFAHVTSGRLVVATNNVARVLPVSADMTSNITGSLVSSTVDVASSKATQACLRFFFKISGWFRDVPMDTLNVFIQSTAGSNQGKRRLIASLSASQAPVGDSLETWVEEKLTVLEPTNYRVNFEASTGDSWIGSLSIDDVQLRATTCPVAFPSS